MADQSDIIQSLIGAVAKNPQLLQGFTSNPEKTVASVAESSGIDLAGVDMGDLIKAVSPLVTGDKLDVSAVAKVAEEFLAGKSEEHQKAAKADEGGLSDILGALGNVFGDGSDHEDKKNENGGIDLSALGGLAAQLFSSK